MQLVFKDTDVRAKSLVIEEYWDVDCCLWNEQGVLQVTCDAESGRVEKVEIYGLTGQFHYQYLPDLITALVIRGAIVSRSVRPLHLLHLSQLSHLAQLQELTLLSVAIDGSSVIRDFPRSLKRISFSSCYCSPTTMRWDFRQLNEYLPNLIELEVQMSNFVARLDFGDVVPQTLETLGFSGCSFRAEGVDFHALESALSAMQFKDIGFFRNGFIYILSRYSSTRSAIDQTKTGYHCLFRYSKLKKMS